MFSSRQIFDVLVDEDQLKPCIDLAMAMTDDTHMFTRTDGRVNMAFAEPAPGIYAIGRGSMPNPSWCQPHEAGRGWTDFQFDYDTSIMSKIIWQWAMKQNYPEAPDTDGSVRKGVRVMSLNTAACQDFMPDYYEVSSRWSPHETILIFVPAWHQYDK